jgi:hypothetical protein
MHGWFGLDRPEHDVDRFGGPRPFVGRTRQIGLVELHDVGLAMLNLLGEDARQRPSELGAVGVMAVDQGLGQHVRARNGEFQRSCREAFCARTGVRQIERAAAELVDDDAGRPAAKAHAGRAAVFDEFLERDRGPHARHRAHEIFDHAVGLGMIGIEAIEFAVADKIDPGALLGMEHDAGRIDQRLLARIRNQPIGDRIRTDQRREDGTHGVRSLLARACAWAPLPRGDCCETERQTRFSSPFVGEGGPERSEGPGEGFEI